MERCLNETQLVEQKQSFIVWVRTNDWDMIRNIKESLDLCTFE